MTTEQQALITRIACALEERNRHHDDTNTILETIAEKLDMIADMAMTTKDGIRVLRVHAEAYVHELPSRLLDAVEDIRLS